MITAYFVMRIMRGDFPLDSIHDGVLSMATGKNIDVSRLIRWHYLYVLVCCPLLVLAVRDFIPRFNLRFRLMPDILGRFPAKMDMYIFSLALGVVVYVPIAMIAGRSTAVNVLLFLACFVVMLLMTERAGTNTMSYVCRPFFTASFLLVFFAEILYSLHDRGVTVNPLTAFAVFYGIVIALVLVRYTKRDNSHTQNMAYVYFCAYMAMIGLVSLRTSEPLSLNLFEWSNHGSAIYEFLAYGNLPLIQNFDPHALSRFFWGVLYAAVTGNKAGAVFAPYEYFNTVLICAGLYLLLRRYVPDKYIFLGAFFFPMYSLRLSYFMGVWLVLYFIHWTKQKPNILHDAVYFLLFVVSGLFLLDVGASWGIAFLMCGIAYRFMNGRRYTLQFFAVGAVVAAAFLTAVLSAMYARNIDILLWLRNFLTACTSNQNWAYGNIGGLMSTALVYCLAPVLMAGVMIRNAEGLRKDKHFLDSWVILFLWMAWVFNLQRALVRHSMMELTAIAFGLIVIVLMVHSLKFYSKYAVNFCLSVMLLSALAIRIPVVNLTEIDSFLRNPRLIVKSLSGDRKTILAVSPEYEAVVSELKIFFDGNLQPSETYIDFTNQTLLYALTGRRKPVYVNQSPGLVNGIRGQQEFIEEVSRVNPPLVLMPYAGDNDDNHSEQIRPSIALRIMRRLFSISTWGGGGHII